MRCEDGDISRARQCAVEFPMKQSSFEKSMIEKKSQKGRRDRQFEVEARRQCFECAAAARNPTSDEATVMCELDAAFDELCREIEAEEVKNQCATLP